jgi:N-methylhydantoinase B/oxoprolinase/acetone carboxylase alpha subunit
LNPITIIIPDGTLLSPSDTAAVVGGKWWPWILIRTEVKCSDCVLIIYFI